ncbi:MAG: hypothetical protein GY696_33530 [Gammaproteobacteria bacterium]|nr:hypothetical protein [Gammaproteobacteria bacterium]
MVELSEADNLLLLLGLPVDLPPNDESLSLNRSLELLTKLGLVCLGTGLKVTEDGGGMSPPPPLDDLPLLLLLAMLARLTEVRLTPGKLASFTDDPLKGSAVMLVLLL